MKSNFKDPIKAPEGTKMDNPWSFKCPQYDERTSCYIEAGTNYGVGHNQPIGHKGNPKTGTEGAMPIGRMEKTQQTDYVNKSGKLKEMILEET